MEVLTVGQILDQVPGKFYGDESVRGIAVSNITHDDFAINKNSVYVLPLNFDNPQEYLNNHLEEIIDKGVALIVTPILPERIEDKGGGVNILLTTYGTKDDAEYFSASREALRRLVHLYVRCFSLPKISITGSAGKGSTTHLLWYIFAQKFSTLRVKVWANEPMCELFKLTDERQVAVIETAAGGPNDNSRNSFQILPDVAVFTTATLAHSEWCTSEDPLEDVAKAKLKLVEHLSPTGRIYIDGNSKYYRKVKTRFGQTLRTYGFTSDMDFYSEDIVHNDDYTTDFVLCTAKGERIPIHLPVAGDHMVFNALAASAVAYDFGFTLEEIKSGLEMFHVEAKRSELIERGLSITLIDNNGSNSYIAVKSSIDSLADYGKGRRTVAILADVSFVGKEPQTIQAHEELGQYINDKDGIDVIVLAGKYAKYAANQIKSPEKTVITFKDEYELLPEVDEIVEEGDLVTVVSYYPVQRFDLITKKLVSSFRSKTVDLKNLTADCVAIFDVNFGKYIYKKNIFKTYIPTAADVNVLVCMIVLRNGHIENYFEIPEELAAKYGLPKGEKIKVADLMYTLIMTFSQREAEMLAVHVCGNVEDFVKKMNEFGQQIGMKHSYFSDIYGRSLESYTCISDMVKLLRYISLNSQFFMNMIKCKEYSVSTSTRKYNLRTNNKTIADKNNLLYNACSCGGSVGLPISRVMENGLRRNLMYSFSNFFRHNGHLYVTIQGSINVEVPVFNEGIWVTHRHQDVYDGSDLKFEDALQMYEYLVSRVSLSTENTQIKSKSSTPAKSDTEEKSQPENTQTKIESNTPLKSDTKEKSQPENTQIKTESNVSSELEIVTNGKDGGSSVFTIKNSQFQSASDYDKVS